MEFYFFRSGYQHYSLVTSEEIEKMRMDERLKVVRGLEENTMKSACRRVTSDLLQPNAVIGKLLWAFRLIIVQRPLYAHSRGSSEPSLSRQRK